MISLLIYGSDRVNLAPFTCFSCAWILSYCSPTFFTICLLVGALLKTRQSRFLPYISQQQIFGSKPFNAAFFQLWKLSSQACNVTTVLSFTDLHFFLHGPTHSWPHPFQMHPIGSLTHFLWAIHYTPSSHNFYEQYIIHQAYGLLGFTYEHK